MAESEPSPNVIYESGQMWKAWLGGGLLIGGAAVNVVVSVLLARHDIDSSSTLVNAQLPAALAALGGFAFLCLGIACRHCGAKWIWMAVSGKLAGKSVRGLVYLNRCPICGEPESRKGPQT